MNKKLLLIAIFSVLKLFLLIFFIAVSWNFFIVKETAKPAYASNLASRLKGIILLQVEQNGEAWYVNPADEKRYYMGRPDDAFDLMRELGIGITNIDLEKIKVADVNLSGDDSDNDGLSDMIEDAFGTDKNKSDTDGDGFSDKEEIMNGYNPNSSGALNLDSDFANSHKGKIFLQVERNGEAWYIYPDNSQRYFLGRPVDAFNVMRSLGLGITDEDLSAIAEAGEEQTCFEQGGTICSTNKTCSGSWLSASDSGKCCSEECMDFTVSDLNYEDSPFGFIQGEVVYGNRPDATFLADLGVYWNKVAAKNGVKFLSKDINDIDFSTEMDFTILDKYVKEILVDNGINLPLPLMIFVEINNEEILLTHDQYRELNTVLIERYNGDGVNDMEGSPKIKYWFVGASEMNTGIGKGLDINARKWKLSEADTAEYVKIGYDLVKSFNSEFRVLLGGSAGMCTWKAGNCVDEDKPQTAEDHFYYNLISEMTGDLFCPEIIFDYHQGSDPTKFKAQIEAMNIVKETLAEFGYLDNDIWTTDVGGSWDGLGGFTEIDQAGDVVRRYAYTIAHGQEKLFWTRIEEYNWKGDTNPFDFYGLVNNPANADGKDWKKLSYYTYKLMVEKLEGSDWDNVQIIQESDNVYIYKFIKQGEPIWVAWRDYFEDTASSKTITLDVGNIDSVEITKAIPNAENGSNLDENNYPDFFKTETKSANGGNITITLGESPVFVEEK